MNDPMTDTPTSRWLHRWSLLTVCAAVVTMGFGSVVTNFKAGMADRTWPTPPDALLRMSPEQRQDVPLVIEHSHRAPAWVAGGSTAVLVALLWLFERRRLVRWVGTAALFGVSFQALLGGLRVTEDARWGTEFKIFHGCFAPVVLGLLVAVAALTSRAVTAAPAGAARLSRWSWYALAAVYGQIVLGVLLRHTYNPLAQRLHLLFAFAAAGSVLVLAGQAWVAGARPLRVAALVLACLLGLQLMLGVEAWMTQLGPTLMAQYGLPEMLPITPGRVAVRTAHVLGGSLLLGAVVWVAVLARWVAGSVARPSVAPHLGEAA
jgi:cytochrome c oxidase assembly protein subunit 15